MQTILLIEDNPGDVRLIREYLSESSRMRLEVATRLETGLERLASGGIDVVLLDLSLPDSHGFDTFRQVHTRTPHVPIVVLTALDNDAVVAETLREGGQDYLLKTHLDHEILRRAIAYAIERQRVTDELRVANQAKDRFLAVLSHELRTPLTPVLLSVSELLDDPKTPDDFRPALSMIRRQIEIEVRLVDDLLDVTRIAHGKMRLNRETVDAHASIRQCLDDCRGDLDAFQLTVDLSAAAHHVDADPVRLQQVLWNLLKNAAKFTPAGGTIAIRSDNQPGQRVALSVSDNGIGIAPEDLSRIFHAFEQGDAGRGRRFGGLGLGLAISRSVVEAHGGRLVASSDGRDRGATFTMDLATVPEPIAPRPVPVPTPSIRSLKILLVEDQPDILHALTRLLRGRGHFVQPVSRLSEAREAASQGGFDLLLSDIELPDGTGLRLMREMRGVPGIAFSGFGADEDVRKSREAGFAAHLTKPVDVRTLWATIARVSEKFS